MWFRASWIKHGARHETWRLVCTDIVSRAIELWRQPGLSAIS